jgi:drug/metabolite transporter (DMT)-like permease
MLSRMATRTPPLVLAALAVVYLVWGTTYLANSIALETLTPSTIGATRFLLAGGLLYAVLRLLGATAPNAREWRASLVTGLLMGLCGNGFVVLGQQWVSSGLVALVVGTMPLWAATLGYALQPRGAAVPGSQAVTRREWLGLGLGFLGIATLQLGGALSAAGLGVLLILLAPMCWALGGVLGRRLPLPAGPMASATQMITGGLGFAVVALVVGDPLPAVPSTRSLLALAYLVVFGSLLGFTAYAYLLRRTRLAIANSYAYVNPVVAIVLGALVLGEPVSALTWVATVIILAAVAVISWRRR